MSPPGPFLAIGALSRATGIPVETIRSWEARYGFPVPERKPSGHRLYPLDAAPRLRRISEAIARGHRASQVVPASDADLSRILGATPAPALTPAPSPGSDLEGYLVHVERSDRARLSAALLSAWSRTTPLAFVETVMSPLVEAIGEAWSSGRLSVRHEHLASECLGDCLRSLRHPWDERANGPTAIITTLPGEQHSLGVQMTALILTVAGWRAHPLGTETPIPEIATLAADLPARAVAISISAASRTSRSRSQLRTLRTQLPRRIQLLTGGAGAPPASAGVTRLSSFAALQAWAETRRPV